MAYFGSQQLEKRLTQIEVKRRAISKGAVYSVNHDGLIISRPRRRGFRFPLRGLFFAIAGLLMFKIGLVASQGAATYAARIEELAEGTAFARICAWVMTVDPATLWVATQIKMLFS